MSILKSLALAVAMLATVAYADQVVLKDGHPDRYVVVKGDTLWDIAQYYTKDAFNYHELARLSGIRNPDRIYPGDKVRIIIR